MTSRNIDIASIKSINVYIAIRNREECSRVEDQLVLDGVNASSFRSAQDLWKQFQIHPARFIITDQRFGAEFDGFKLVGKIRKYSATTYVYILMRSVREQLKLRSRLLVGMRWLTYIDSIMGRK
ncbi:MAG: hypothetical protein ABI042_10650 [Verrucomicrobiota bacterium]